MFITHKYSCSKLSAFRCLSALFLLALFFTSPIHAAPWSWDGATQGDFITALCSDAQGRVFVGTEDMGVWRYDPRTENGWTHFTTQDGLGDDNAYALAVDHQNRLWVGHLRSGVSVWNGAKWKNYDVLDGPLGERVFDIAICPTDGDVWIATNAGLSRYRVKSDAWSYYTRAEGLPSDQIQAVAFDKSGNIIVGTQCDGLALANAKDGYTKWRSVVGPDDLPTTPFGDGLPGNLINDVLVAQSGTIYVATTRGLAQSDDGGKSWSYVRGADYAAKVRDSMAGAPRRWQERPGAELAEDYITCLAEDASGRILIGHRQKPYEVFDVKSGVRVYDGMQDVNVALPQDYVTSILPRKDAPPLLGRYGSGVARSELAAKAGSGATSADMSTHVAANTANATEVQAALPSPAKAPGVEELQSMLKRVQGLKKPMQPGDGAYLGEDWRTWGDWVGRYGRRHTTLCAVETPDNARIAPGTVGAYYRVNGVIGPHHAEGDELRAYVPSGLVKTDWPKVLYNPVLGYRREAEWDDHGEAYPMSYEGPDVWVTVRVPEGPHRVTLYFFNKDGHQDNNRFRDYLLELKAWTPNLREAQAQPPLVQARVRDFWGPVYKQFIVQGPGKFYVRIAKNDSFNTILQSVMVDALISAGPSFDDLYRLMEAGGTRLSAESKRGVRMPLFDVNLLGEMGDVRYGGAPYTIPPSDLADTRTKDTFLLVKSANDLWTDLDRAYRVRDSYALQWPNRIFALRSASTIQDNEAVKSLQDNWRWRLKIWTPQQREEFKEVMARGFQARVAQIEFRKGKTVVTKPVGNRYFVASWEEPDEGMKALLDSMERKTQEREKQSTPEK